jgi:hypothetical protein
MYGELNEDVFADALKPALEALEAMKATNTDDPEEPNRMPSKAIEMVPHVFQVRGTDIAEQHVGDLLSVLKGGRSLDPVLIWRCGKHALLVDGHHRLEAYQRFQLERQARFDVPVTWFHGSADEAMRAAAQANVPAKLQMNHEQRANLAWKLAVLDRHKKAEIAAISGVATRTVAKMREIMRKLRDEAVSIKSWAMALMRSKDDEGEMSDADHAEWLDLQAKAWADRMAKTFMNKLTTNPTQAGKVLSIHFQRASKDAILEWIKASDMAIDEVREMFDELLNPEF